MHSKTAYIVGAYQAFMETGHLLPATFEKMAQSAEIASAATPDEVGMVGSSITGQDISSLAKILSVLTQLQQMYMEQQQMGGGMPPEMMGGGMPPQGMPPQGMQAPGPGPQVM